MENGDVPKGPSHKRQSSNDGLATTWPKANGCAPTLSKTATNRQTSADVSDMKGSVIVYVLLCTCMMFVGINNIQFSYEWHGM